ncbi:DUF1766-domain-containing protein [Coniochaeta sp. PMI_546]|nr:DUF1766-domain-containing protein [Coniochaeta sp. PMI_546]
MSSTATKKDEMAASMSNLPKTQISGSKSVPYPSPPNSPAQTKAHTPEVPRVFVNKARPADTLYSTPVTPPTTPPRQSTASRVAQKKPTENNVDVGSLRTRLGLQNRLCGGRTKSGRPCRISSPTANAAQVTAQLKSMVSLTQSSPELEAALDKLAMLVHCNYHDNGLPKKARIEDWTAVFPAGEVDPDPAATVEKRIRKILSLESTQCIGIAASTGSRCQRNIGGQKTNMYCHLHVKQKPLKLVSSWKSSIVDCRKGMLLKSSESSTPELRRGSIRVTNTPRSDTSSTTTSAGSVVSRGRLPTPNFDRDLSTFWPAAYDTSPFKIIPKSAAERLADYKSSCAKVKNEMTKELDPKDPSSGYVYMYEVDGNKGFVKIGYTGRSVEERHQDWDFACNRAPRALYPLPSGPAAAVQNPHRIEELCHAELDHRRIRIECKACLKQHLEWFEVSPAEAIAVIKKWSKWMATDPYQRIELRSGVKWTIKEEERKRTRDMDRFLKEISVSPK